MPIVPRYAGVCISFLGGSGNSAQCVGRSRGRMTHSPSSPYRATSHASCSMKGFFDHSPQCRSVPVQSRIRRSRGAVDISCQLLIFGSILSLRWRLYIYSLARYNPRAKSASSTSFKLFLPKFGIRNSSRCVWQISLPTVSVPSFFRQQHARVLNLSTFIDSGYLFIH